MKLKTLEEHNRIVLAAYEAAQKSGIACPACGNETEWTSGSNILMSQPPKRGIWCACGWSGTALV